MLQKSTEQREEVESEVLSTLNRLVLPIISKMKRCDKIEDAQGHVKTLESSLKKMGSSFTRKLSILYTALSPREIQVANLIIGLETNSRCAKTKISLYLDMSD